MHYKCKKCDYEFDVFTTPHPHQGMFIGPIGCPVCARAQAMSKVCQKCGSVQLEQTLAIKKEEE
jgi:transposase-like protein